MSALLIACGALAREVIALRDKHQWDAQIFALPALLHNTPERIPDAVFNKITTMRHNYDRVIVVYGDCGTAGALDSLLDDIDIERVQGPHCYEMYAGDEFQAMMDEAPGTYFLTDYLLQSFDHLVIEGLGLDRFPELHEMYFGNYQRVIYLRQRDDANLLTKAKEAATFLQLPLEIRPATYGALESRLQALLENAKKP